MQKRYDFIFFNMDDAVAKGFILSKVIIKKLPPCAIIFLTY